MSEQEEFEKWAEQQGLWLDKNKGHYVDIETNNASEIWQACDEQKNKIINKQAAELAALRGFANAIQYDLELENWGAYPKGLLKIYKLIDENGKPTKLLTGEE